MHLNHRGLCVSTVAGVSVQIDLPTQPLTFLELFDGRNNRRASISPKIAVRSLLLNFHNYYQRKASSACLPDLLAFRLVEGRCFAPFIGNHACQRTKHPSECIFSVVTLPSPFSPHLRT